MPVLSWDYAFLGSRTGYSGHTVEGPTEEECERAGHSPLLVMADSRSKGYHAALHPEKGSQFEGIEALVNWWTGALDRLAYQRVVFRSDNEPALLAFLQRVKEAWTVEVVSEGSARGDPQSNGAAEAGVGVVKGLVRTLKIALQSRLQREIPAEHPVMAWLVRYASASYRRYRVGPDGRTPYERSVGRRCSTLVAEFGEAIWFTPLLRDSAGDDRRKQPGYYLGPVGREKGVVDRNEPRHV